MSDTYINNCTKLHYICPKGHKHWVTWGHWNTSKSRCPYCVGQMKYTLQYAVQKFRDIGYILLADVYINSKIKMKCRCKNGHIVYMSLYSVLNGHKCRICTVINNRGSGNPNWKGGISKEPYCQDWTKDLKEFVKQRDCHRCLNPYCNSKNPNDLTVHHINYNKKLCGVEDLITICRSCNNKANSDREWHESWYKAILYRRYNIKNNL